jgi:hypothetical protein
MHNFQSNHYFEMKFYQDILEALFYVGLKFHSNRGSGMPCNKNQNFFFFTRITLFS